ncbi:3-keto-disaccharide hydrolase [Frigoriglobus tundricola]|uniref:Putative multi-domain protein n=1 Tax=Frigoriglobus tundricola TaxID=2774151 RepID=A0A6M5YZE8_9BACT|nr:DUF1080 domain-containing protein [Frigoriglobus tundricola]QJW99507.1 putative multi-domain protein [Frigoriglobus tundricola]
MFRLFLPAVAVAFAILPAPAADEKPIVAFNGKNLDGWKARDEKKSHWQVCAVGFDAKKPDQLLGGVNNAPAGTGSALANITPGCDIYTEAKFGDVHVEVEFMIPKGSNSGVYLMGEYEVQILDSFGKPDAQLKPGDMGGIYTTAAPKKNVCKKPGEWQTFVIDFQAPKFEGEKKTANAKFVKVTFNDVVIHENVEVKGSTGSGLTGKEHPTGPLMFQGDHGPVAFRTVKITPKK